MDAKVVDKNRVSLREWAETIKFSHSVFALPFALIAAFLAGRQLEEGLPTLTHLGLIVLCMVAARSVAMTFNRIADAAIDARNLRTANRALPAGRLTRGQAWSFLAGSAVVFVLACAGFYWRFDNPYPLIFAVPVLLFLCSYSYAKRFTRFSHLWLGAAIGLSPLAAWIAINPIGVGWTAFLLLATVACWIAGFDIIYSCQDIEIDRAEGLFSLPSRIGPARALLLTRLMHCCVVVFLVSVGFLSHLGWLYFTGVLLAGILLLAENLCVKPNDFSKVNLAFFTINGVVSLVLSVFAIADILMGMPAVF